jgi:mono/diheme cytochrome c family protein
MKHHRRHPEAPRRLWRRAWKGGREHRARFHPSRLAQQGERLRMTAAVVLVLALSPLAARAQGSAHFSPLFRFTEQSGEQLFANVCQGCHMPDAQGAIGAGTYPSLAANKNLEAAGYPVYLVVRGQRAMPPFGAMMSDNQVAAVVNYVRTHFGNNYTDAVTAEDVKAARP